MLAPSLKLDGNMVITPEAGAYPFGVTPDKLITPADVFAIYRDYYEGTPYSLVENTPAAGPFNSPIRISSGPEEANYPTGAWERPISIYRNNYNVLSSLPSEGNGIVWFAPHTAFGSVFAPMWTSAATSVARSYVVDKTKNVDRESLFAAASIATNWAYGSNFNMAMADIRTVQVPLEKEGFALATQLTTSTSNHDSLLQAHAAKVFTRYWDLVWDLMGKYQDGYVVTHDASGAPNSVAVGYPKWWLDAVGFSKAVASDVDDFAKLKDRMTKAQAQMDEIDRKRKYAVAHDGSAELIV